MSVVVQCVRRGQFSLLQLPLLGKISGHCEDLAPELGVGLAETTVSDQLELLQTPITHEAVETNEGSLHGLLFTAHAERLQGEVPGFPGDP